MDGWACFVCLVALLAPVCTAQTEDGNPCTAMNSQVSCDSCISASHLCSWCPFSPNITTVSQRCRMTSEPCPGESIAENPRPEVTVTRNEPLTVTIGQDDGLDTVQVSPQNISLTLRRDLPSSFNMTFRSLRNSPLDLYFLIDFSSSQSLVLGQLRTQLPLIAEAVRNVSTNFLIGFGSFVDKPTLPYAAFDYRSNTSVFGLRCSGFGQCDPTYSFIHTQPLTDDLEELQDSFNASVLSSNYDAPEGCLEALLQVAVCTNETGWRPNALHMVFMITDEGYHLAGDGKLAGIVTPNDGLCHLEKGEDGIMQYTHGLLQDYPSLFQIRRSLESNLIVPIFTLRVSALSEVRVNMSLLPSYNRLIEDLRSSSAQAIVFRDNSTEEIIRVIEDSYARTVQNIRVNVPTVPGYTFAIDPIEGCETRGEDSSCQLQFDDDVTYRVTVTLDDCAEASRQSVQLLGPPFSFTTIDLQPICQCPCTAEGPETDSDLCSSKGNLTCGLCSCDPFFGNQCECNTSVTDCPSETEADCSGNGECTSCGTCRCLDGFFGAACQCVPTDCQGSCSGNGRCTCGLPGSVPTCDCDLAPLSGFPLTRECTCNPDNCFNVDFPTDLCHITEGNNGTGRDGTEFCGCNGCQCPSGFQAQGNICILREDVCTADNLILICVRCSIGDINNRTDPRCSDCDPPAIDLGDLMQPTNVSQVCRFPIGSCEFTVFIDFPDGQRRLYYSLEGCTNQALPWIITGSLVGAIIALGLLFLVILKLLLVAWDRHEYKKFTQELKDADFSPMDNPLYLTPQQDYPNPILRAKVVPPPQEY